jgi:hypothetical protein
MLHYHPLDCFEADVCVLCGDSDIVYTSTLILRDATPGSRAEYFPYMLCDDCAHLEGVKTVVEGVLTKVVRRRDWMKESPPPPIQLPDTLS